MKWLFPLFAASGLLAMGLDVSGEALYLRPSLGLPYTVIKSPNIFVGSDTPVSGQRVGANKPPYAWGYRLSANYACVHASWMSWIHTNRTTINAPGLDQRLWLIWDTPGNSSGNAARNATARQLDQYKVENFDVDYSYGMLILGVRFSRVRDNTLLDVSGSFENGTSGGQWNNRWKSSVQGIGPRIGSNFCHLGRWGFSFLCEASASLLLARAKGHYFLEVVRPTLPRQLVTFDISSPSRNAIILMGDLSCAIRWSSLCLFSYALDAEVGYLIRYYSQGTERTRLLTNRFTGDVLNQAFALDGFNFRLGIKY